DARVRDLRTARLGDAGCGRDADRLRRDVHEGVAGLPAVRAPRPGRRPRAAPLRRPGGRVRTGCVRVRRGAARVAGAAQRRRVATGTGLKTPQLAESTGRVVEIDADVDELLDRLGVAA